MIVTCNSMDELIEELSNPDIAVHGKTVRISTSKRRLDTVRHMVVVQVSAIIVEKGGNEYLVQFGEECGIDYSDSSQEFAGSEKAKKLRKILTEVCEKLSLKVGPGVIGI